MLVKPCVCTNGGSWIHLCLLLQARHESTDCGMKQILSELVPQKQKEVKEFRGKSGNFVVGEVTVDMVSPAGGAAEKFTGYGINLSLSSSDVRWDAGDQGASDGNLPAGPRGRHSLQGLQHPRVPGTPAQGRGRTRATPRGHLLPPAHWEDPHCG